MLTRLVVRGCERQLSPRLKKQKDAFLRRAVENLSLLRIDDESRKRTWKLFPFAGWVMPGVRGAVTITPVELIDTDERERECTR